MKCSVAAAAEKKDGGNYQDDPYGAVVTVKNVAAHSCNLTVFLIEESHRGDFGLYYAVPVKNVYDIQGENL